MSNADKTQTTELAARLRAAAEEIAGWGAGNEAATVREAVGEIERLRTAVARARPLVALVTVRQVIEAGDREIDAAGLNPWCINEGLATGDEKISTWWME